MSIARKALRITQSLSLLQALVLAVLTWSGHIAVWHLVVLALWLGVVHAFDVPLRQRLWVNLVEDRADLPNVVALNSMLVNSARIIGPALAGAPARGRQRSCVLRAQRAVFRLAVIVAISANALGARTRTGAPGKAVSGRNGSKGIASFRASRRRARCCFCSRVLSWTISPYSSLMPVYAKDIVRRQPADRLDSCWRRRARAPSRARSISPAARRFAGSGESSPSRRVG